MAKELEQVMPDFSVPLSNQAFIFKEEIFERKQMSLLKGNYLNLYRVFRIIKQTKLFCSPALLVEKSKEPLEQLDTESVEKSFEQEEEFDSESSSFIEERDLNELEVKEHGNKIDWDCTSIEDLLIKSDIDKDESKENTKVKSLNCEFQIQDKPIIIKYNSSYLYTKRRFDKEEMNSSIEYGLEIEETCCVCVSQYRIGDFAVQLHVCGHLFHKTCIDAWIREGEAVIPTCPLCKLKL